MRSPFFHLFITTAQREASSHSGFHPSHGGLTGMFRVRVREGEQIAAERSEVAICD